MIFIDLKESLLINQRMIINVQAFTLSKQLIKPLKPRDPHESHRVATSLELLFDLIFVVAIATAGQQLHHSMIENHVTFGLTQYFIHGVFCFVVGLDEFYVVCICL